MGVADRPPRVVRAPRGDMERAAVVDLWRAVELFSAAQVPRERDAGVTALEAGARMPWPAATAAPRGRVWRYAVHLGQMALSDLYRCLSEVFPPGRESGYEPPAQGRTAPAALVLDQDGVPVEGSAVLAHCAWATGRVLAEGAGADLGAGPARAGAEFAAVVGEYAGVPAGTGTLATLADEALRIVGLAGRIAGGPPVVRAYHVDARAAEEGGEGVLLNGFHGRDLDRVAAAVRRGDYGSALWRYLAPEDEVDADARGDVLRDPAVAAALDDPAAVPAGRWPAPADTPLERGQQRAVNAVVGRLGGVAGGLAAINGPPGTGKTTTLRDLVAAVVTERALRLADLARPDDAFAARLEWGGSGDRVVWGLAEHLAGGELVLACTTNAAAENVSLEIPAAPAVGREHREGADPLAALGSLALEAWRRGSMGDSVARAPAAGPAWGLLAACLGSRRRNRDFAGAVWWGRLPEEREGGDQLSLAGAGMAPSHPGLRRLLAGAAAAGGAAPEGVPSWGEAVARVRAAHAAVRSGRPGVPDGVDDPAWCAARTEAFLASLALHRALLFGAARRMGDTLRATMDLVAGRAPAGLGAAAALAAWRALFLVVPVVSTTFASLPRVFAALGREELGWLLVDEAAQVAPHEAVGGIWRARRLVALGDPRQLEPIVSLPAATEEGLRARHGVPERWSPARSSVQRLADRACPEGTRDGDGPEAGWVGLPLTRHRRCEEPMFTIVNRMAYAGRMVNATPAWPGPALPPSAWLDVRGTAGEGHWVPEEGERLQRVLAHLELRSVPPSALLLLTPFRDVARQLEALVRGRSGPAAGTVHTAQGREADIVVLVLGAGAAHPGAMRWATARPNLLNVAVSRARRRLWVIGDHRAWSDLPHARELARALPVKGA